MGYVLCLLEVLWLSAFLFQFPPTTRAPWSLQPCSCTSEEPSTSDMTITYLLPEFPGTVLPKEKYNVSHIRNIKSSSTL